MIARYPNREQGTAAVELAIICVMAIAIIPLIFLFGRVFWHYNVLKQAAYDAANYIAYASTSRMVADSGDIRNTAAVLVANAAAASGMDPVMDVSTICLPKFYCAQTNSGTIKVVVMATITDPGFAAFNSIFLDYEEFQFAVTAEVPYASRLAEP